MRLARLTASTTLLIFMSAGPGTSKPVPPATMEGLATAWVGGTAWSDYVRLDLTPDGTGTLVIQFLPKHPVRAYRITRTILIGYALNFQIEPAEPDAEPIRVGGKAYPLDLDLQIRGAAREWQIKVSLERLRDLTDSLDAVTRRAKEISP